MITNTIPPSYSHLRNSAHISFSVHMITNTIPPSYSHLRNSARISFSVHMIANITPPPSSYSHLKNTVHISFSVHMIANTTTPSRSYSHLKNSAHISASRMETRLAGVETFHGELCGIRFADHCKGNGAFDWLIDLLLRSRQYCLVHVKQKLAAVFGSEMALSLFDVSETDLLSSNHYSCDSYLDVVFITFIT